MATRFSPTQQKMLDVLADGKPHPAADLHACLYDDQGPIANIYSHLTFLRKMLRAEGRDVASVRAGGSVSFCLVDLPLRKCVGSKVGF